MARTKPSPTHLALVQLIEALGGTATTTQVERWQQHGWIPKTSAWREAGSTRLRPEILHRALWLASTARAGRSIGWWGWVFWAVDDTPDSAQRLRGALVATLKRPMVRAGVERIPTGNSNQAFQARQDAAARMLTNHRAPRRDLDETLRVHAAEAGLELTRSPEALPNVFHPALMDPGARLLLGGAADVGIEELLEALARAMPDNPEMIERIREAHRQAELAGIDLLAQSPWAQGISGMVRTVERADDRILCHAVHTCARATFVLKALMRYAPGEPEILVRLMEDVMWERWGRFAGVTPEGVPGLAALALDTFRCLADLDWAVELERYLVFMHTLLVAYPERLGFPADRTEA
ncbi:hypothetical protein OG592_44485 (plasmid) [Streptomyces avidinii]|uniref:hypothetical protein n=1 Tax=Streptomyces avidinii TaxID=1895 RepID=UPI002F9156CD|nr:hypothetical protein OG592_44485 [Streptomyces avidinii]